jgi:hypothetical protein
VRQAGKASKACEHTGGIAAVNPTTSVELPSCSQSAMSSSHQDCSMQAKRQACKAGKARSQADMAELPTLNPRHSARADTWICRQSSSHLQAACGQHPGESRFHHV